MRKVLFLILALAVLGPMASAQLTITLPKDGDKFLLNKEWLARQASAIVVDGTIITSGQTDFSAWIPATVPGTILTTQLNNGLIPSPYWGLNNRLIPDIHDVGNDYYTYWFVNQFKVSKPEAGKIVWLNFRGINYRAEIFLNGRRVNTSTHEGMFHRTSYDITRLLRADSLNTLAVWVAPPYHSGADNGGQGGDGQIARNVTMHFTPGWDWIQAVRDRATGIWDEVSITQTGKIRLLNPHIITKVSGVRQPKGKQADAVLKVTAELQNLTDGPQTTTLAYEVGGLKNTLSVTLNPYETRIVSFKDMTMTNPRLWWPNGMGKQELYTMVLKASHNGTQSDQQQVTFGVRELTTLKDPATGGRMFMVNGQKVFIRGGNYIASDWMLQLSEERYRTEVKFHADMNLNMIRIWGGALPERPEFYSACDEYGMLVFQDLSVTGDANGAWNDQKKKDSRERRHAYPDNHALFLHYVEDQVKLLRNHPSLALWCGGNEWPAAVDIDRALKYDLMPRLDPERHFASFSTDTTFTRNTIGGVGDGPYGIQEPEWFFTFRSTPFNPELGSVGIPEARAMRAIMSEQDFNQFPRANLRWLNPVWEYHKYISYDQHIARYGEPKTGEEFCDIAQLINYNQYRAFMEGWTSHMWDWYTGVLIWKTQNPWTALRGQMYDWYLDQNACYYGTRKGCEPLHIQFNLKTTAVEITNTTLDSYPKLMARARWYSLDGKILDEKTVDVAVVTNGVTPVFEAPQPKGINGAYFLRLQLADGNKVLSDNVYWQSIQPNNYTSLARLPKSDAKNSVSLASTGNNNYQAEVKIKANGTISFFNRIYVLNNKTGQRILPVDYSDNYITVFPNEETVITLSFTSDVPKEDLEINIQSRN